MEQLMAFDLDKVLSAAQSMRGDIFRRITAAGSGHPGGSLSAADIVATRYYGDVLRFRADDPAWPGRDRFILSKGHAAPVLYAALAHAGYLPREELASLRKLGSRLQGHPDMRKLPGVEASTGSLGQGLSIALGMAIGLAVGGCGAGGAVGAGGGADGGYGGSAGGDGANGAGAVDAVGAGDGANGAGGCGAGGAADAGGDGSGAQGGPKMPPRVFVLLGDGEMQEGQVWEALMLAAHLKVANLTAIIDCNGLQIDGRLSEVNDIGDINAKLTAFGWRTLDCDGHDPLAIKAAFDAAATDDGEMPCAIIARTVKGKGVSFMEGLCGWHGKAPSAEQCEAALSEVGVH
jgi:transketolase N-terminal domain/subunit